MMVGWEYVVLGLATGWALGALIRTSSHLCRGNPYHRPHEEDDDD